MLRKRILMEVCWIDDGSGTGRVGRRLEALFDPCSTCLNACKPLRIQPIAILLGRLGPAAFALQPFNWPHSQDSTEEISRAWYAGNGSPQWGFVADNCWNLLFKTVRRGLVLLELRVCEWVKLDTAEHVRCEPKYPVKGERGVQLWINSQIPSSGTLRKWHLIMCTWLTAFPPKSQ